jgi:hypothetical protein
MANFTRANGSGWSLNAPLTSAQLNQLDIDHTKAINGDDGSTHSPTTPITINGSNGIKVATLELSDQVKTTNAGSSLKLVTTAAEIAFDANDASAHAIRCTQQTGTGATAAGTLTIEGQKGRAQSGGANNNDGGVLFLEPGDRGTGGSGTGGRGFGGAALDGELTFLWGTSERRVRMWAESFDLASGAVATKIVNVDLLNNKTPHLLTVELVSIEDGGGSSLKTAFQILHWWVKKEGTTMTSSTAQPGPTASSFTGNAPTITLNAPGDGSVDIRVAGAPSENSANTMYVTLKCGKVSA